MIDDFVKIAEVFAKLIGSFAWPVVALYLIWRFAPPIRDFLWNMSEGSVKAFGMEATARRRDATIALAAAELKSIDPGSARSTSLWLERSVGKTFRLADFVTSSVPLREVKGKRVLWVDDNPGNNVNERRALSDLGLEVEAVRTTEAAIEALRTRSYDVVISDMRRLESERAGYELLATLKQEGSQTPFIIYSSTNEPHHEQEALEKGAFGSTNSASDLIILVVNAVRSFGKSDLTRNWSAYMNQYIMAQGRHRK